MERVICPVCSEQGGKSTAQSLDNGFRTLLMHYPYYDEEGLYHDHDPNGHGEGARFRCSLGHEWAPAYRGCPNCDWGTQPMKIRERRSFIQQCAEDGHADWRGSSRLTPDGRVVRDPYETCDRCKARRELITNSTPPPPSH